MSIKYHLMLALCCTAMLFPVHSYSQEPNTNESEKLQKLKQNLNISAPEEKVSILNQIGWEYRNSNLRLSLQYFDESTHLARINNDDKGLAEALNMKGVTYRKLGNYNKAIDLFFESLKISEKLKDTTQVAYAFNNMGEVYTYQLNHSSSEEYIKKALALFKKIKDKKGIAYCYLRLAENFESQNNLRQALKHFLLCAEIRKELQDKRGLAVVYGSIGNIYLKLQQTGKAKEYIQKALKFYPENDKSGIAQSNTTIARIYQQLGQLEEAETYAQKGLDLALEFNSKKITLEASLLLSEILEKQGRIKDAFELQKQVLLYKDDLFAEEANNSINNLRAGYESEKQTIEIENYQRIQKIQQKENKLKTRLLYVSITALVLIIVFMGLLYRNYRHNKKITRQTEEQKEEILGIAENLKKANKEISRKTKIIERKNKDLTSSINYAQRIQQAMLPSAKILENTLPEHFVLFQPKDIVSGDFYWVTEKKYKTIVAVADCTGHGIPGAFMSLIGNDLLNEIVLGRNITEPDKILSELRRLIRIVLRQEETGNHDGMDITICTFDKFPEGYEDLLGTPQLEFAGAENPLYYFINGKFNEIRGSKAMIGGFNVLEREHGFKKYSISLEKTQLPLTFYLFSDGYQDQFGEKGKFMKRRFKDLLTQIHQEDMNKQKQILAQTISEWTGEHAQMDDMLVLGVRIS